jgi:hypothetical protein
MDGLKKQEIISTPESKGMRTPVSAKPSVITATELPVRCEFRLSECSTAPYGHYETEQEYRRLKSKALTRPPSARRTRNQQADVQPADPALILQSLRLPADFAGIEDAGGAPPDGCLAVGPAHLMVAVNAACAVFDKSGKQLLFAELSDWFAPVAAQAEIFSPQVIFDHQRGCWLLAACARSREQLRSFLLLAVSHTPDPRGQWWVWALDASLEGSLKTGLWADGLGLAVDNSAVYLTANMLDHQARFAYAKLRILYKREVYTGSVLHGWDFWDLRNPNGTPAFGLRPALNFAPADEQYFLNALPDGKGLAQWSVTLPLRVPPQLSRRYVMTLDYRLAPNTTLPDPKSHSSLEVETGDTRLCNVVFRNGSLWTAHTVSANWGGDTNVAAIQWFQINPQTGAAIQQGVYGTPHAHYFCPAVMVDRHNRMLLVFNRTGENEFPAIRFTGRRASDRANTLQASALLKQSPVPGGKVWSACSGAALDPNGSDFWIIGQYTVGHNEWATWIGETTYAPRATDYNAPSVRSRNRGKAARAACA